VTIADIPPSESACILAKLNDLLRDRFQISHTTIQFEHTGCGELEGCVVPMEELTNGASPGHHGHAHEL
jgi:cobalt-zinc-cadmium efflux system protein